MRYTFKWKVQDGVGGVKRGEDTIEIAKEIVLSNLDDIISDAVTGKSEYRNYDLTLGICQEIDCCDGGCANWKVYGLKKKKED